MAINHWNHSKLLLCVWMHFHCFFGNSVFSGVTLYLKGSTGFKGIQTPYFKKLLVVCSSKGVTCFILMQENINTRYCSQKGTEGSDLRLHAWWDFGDLPCGPACHHPQSSPLTSVTVHAASGCHNLDIRLQSQASQSPLMKLQGTYGLLLQVLNGLFF